MGTTALRLRDDIRQAVRGAGDPVAAHRAAVARLAEVVPFDRWCGLVVDPATILTTAGYYDEGLPPERIPRLLEVECVNDVNVLPTLARTPAGVSTVHRATAGKPERSVRYTDVLAPAGLGRELRAVLRERTVVWGGLVLMRETAAPDFSDAELQLVADVGEEIGKALRRTLLRSELRHRDAPDVPGMALVDGDELAVVSESARRWFAALPDGLVAGSGLPFVVWTLVSNARRSHGPVLERLRTDDGQWLTLHAERLDDRQVFIAVEPTRPYELAAVICDAYGLTPRERDVTRLLVNGCSNKEIAEALLVSHWTVQDHVKNVFEKVDVHSRPDLVTRLFFDQYVPRLLAGLPVGADGWFITGS